MRTLARERDKVEILRRLRAVRAHTPRKWGRMSAHQMICHLNDSFRVAMGLRSASSATSVLQRTIVKWVALYLPLRWPPGIATRPEIDQEVGGTRPADFERDVAELEAVVARFTAMTLDFECQAHPMFGRMSTRDWLRWGYLHTDHHLRQFGA